MAELEVLPGRSRCFSHVRVSPCRVVSSSCGTRPPLAVCSTPYERLQSGTNVLDEDRRPALTVPGSRWMFLGIVHLHPISLPRGSSETPERNSPVYVSARPLYRRCAMPVLQWLVCGVVCSCGRIRDVTDSIESQWIPVFVSTHNTGPPLPCRCPQYEGERQRRPHGVTLRRVRRIVLPLAGGGLDVLIVARRLSISGLTLSELLVPIDRPSRWSERLACVCTLCVRSQDNRA